MISIHIKENKQATWENVFELVDEITYKLKKACEDAQSLLEEIEDNIGQAEPDWKGDY